MRKGQAGNWKKHFKPGMEERFQQWEERWLKGTGLEFVYVV